MEGEDRFDCRSRFVPLIYFTFASGNMLLPKHYNGKVLRSVELESQQNPSVNKYNEIVMK